MKKERKFWIQSWNRTSWIFVAVGGRRKICYPSERLEPQIPRSCNRMLCPLNFREICFLLVLYHSVGENTIAWMENFKIQTVTRDSDLLSTSFIMKKNSLIWCRLQIIKHRYLRLVVGSCVTTGFRRLLHVRTNPFLSREPSECRRMRAWLDIVWNFSSTEMKGKNGQTTKIQMASAVLFFSVFRHHSWNLLRST